MGKFENSNNSNANPSVFKDILSHIPRIRLMLGDFLLKHISLVFVLQPLKLNVCISLDTIFPISAYLNNLLTILPLRL